jgi:uncharacterized protein (TIGR03000 family)
MFRKAFSFGGLLLLAGAAVLVTPGSGQAQHHGGGGHGGGSAHGGGGGGHGGGFHSGGFNHGGFNHGGFSHGDFHHDGFHHNGFHHNGFHHDGFHHDGFHHGGGLWSYPRYYGYYGASPYNYGYYPYYGGSDYYPSYRYSDYYPYTYGSDWSSPAYDSGYYGSYGYATPSYPDSYSPAAAQPDTSARITLNVPEDAEIWFAGSKMMSPGSVREYQSPPLTPGIRYTYEVRARWNENGHEVTQTQQVEVTAEARANVYFPVQPTKAPTAPSP